MKRLIAPLLLLAFSAVAAEPAKAPLKAGTTIVGEHEAAIGLFLTPWKDEDTPPPARSPGKYTVQLMAANVSEDRARSEAIETVDSYQRARRQALR